MLEKLPIIGRLYGDGCDHERIRIVGMGQDAEAIYKCKECDKRVYPWKLEGKYVYDGGNND